MGFDSSSSMDTRNPENVDELMQALYATWPAKR
jgi:hypothetical protein